MVSQYNSNYNFLFCKNFKLYLIYFIAKHQEEREKQLRKERLKKQKEAEERKKRDEERQKKREKEEAIALKQLQKEIEK